MIKVHDAVCLPLSCENIFFSVILFKNYELSIFQSYKLPIVVNYGLRSDEVINILKKYIHEKMKFIITKCK